MIKEFPIYRVVTTFPKIQESKRFTILVPALSIDDAMSLVYASDWFDLETEEIVKVKLTKRVALVVVREDKSDGEGAC